MKTEPDPSDRRREALFALDERLRGVADTADLSFAASELLGETLGAVRVGFGVLDPAKRTITVERNWSAPGFVDVAGVHSFDAYGTYIDELLQGTPVANADVRTDPRTAANVPSFDALGIAAHLDVPVVEDGRAVAQMFVHAPVPRRWREEEIVLVREFAERTRAAIARRAAEAALRESEARYRTLFENIDVGFCIIEVLFDADDRPCDYRFLEANPAFDRQAGFEANGRRMREIVPDHEQYWFDLYGRVATTGEPLRVEQGSATLGRWWDVHAFRVGRPEERRVAVLFSDITARRKAELGLQQLNETLEAQVADRVAELEATQEALRQAQKMEAMGQLTGGVAHDFNNLLTPIIGSLDLLQRKEIGGERERRLIDGALQSAERAKTLVQRLLAFARRQPLQPTAVDLGRLVAGMVELIGSTLGPMIELRIDLPADLPPALADPNQLEMALLNLAVNARDAMPEGGRLTISARRESVRTAHSGGLKRGHYVRLSVADTGAGMDEATKARAIEPFFSTKGVGKGTGLGLSMVHGLVAQLGGTLAIDSAPGRGATIELWLPISTVAIEGEADPLEPAPPTQAMGTALLVDDEELVRMSTADMLADLGYAVVEASGAEEALRLMQEGLKPDLLVTDHLMPGMNGAELAHAIKELMPDLPVLIVSGYAEAEGISPALARLTKPFRNAELAASLAALTPRD